MSLFKQLIAVTAALCIFLCGMTACGGNENETVETGATTVDRHTTQTTTATTTTMPTTTTQTTTTTRFPVDPALITEPTPSTVYILEGPEWVEQLEIERETDEIYDYYVDLLIEDVLDDLQTAYGYTYEEAEDVLFEGGLSIYSYEEPAAQAAVSAVFEDSANFPDAGGSDYLNAAIFITDYEGRVIATVGSRGTKWNNRSWSLATEAKRQPGSAIKPLAVYAPALEADLINYSTLAPNEPLQLSDGTEWPHNIGETTAMASGYRTIRYAVEQSFNTIAVQVLAKVGANTSYAFMTEKLRFTSLSDEDRNLSALGLGGVHNGVTVREMASAYQIFGNGGYYYSPHTYQKVMCGNLVLLEHTPEKDPVISPETATIMNKLLQNVVRNGTAAAIADSWPTTEVFAKTGTTDGNRDSYFAGGTPYCVGAVWMGYEYNTSMTDYQRAFAKELWNKCMLALHAELPAATFDTWGNVEQHSYNTYNGVVSENGTETGWYKADAVPYVNNTFGSIDCTPPADPSR